MGDSALSTRSTYRQPGVRATCAVIASLLAFVAFSGCENGTQTPARTTQSPLSNTDPCATRLHDLCGPLLLYFGRFQRLPEELRELADAPGLAVNQAITCPASGRPYVYDPDSMIRHEDAVAIVYDAAPSHAGFRWAIIIAEPAPGAPLITKVVALPESRFSRPATAPH